MADKKFNVDARAGFMPFDLADLQDLWTNLKDGNYWTAFRKAVHILDDLINPTVGRTRVSTHTVEIAERVDECCENLEQWIEEHENDPDSKKLGKLHEPNAEAVPIAEILIIVRLILQFISDWRKRRENPQMERGARTAESPRKFNVRPNPLAKGQLMSDKKETPPEVNRPAGVTNDQPAPMATNPSDPSGKSIPVTEETNTKADTLAGDQSYAPGEAKHTPTGEDVAEQRPLEGNTPAVTPTPAKPPSEPAKPQIPVPPKSPPPSPPTPPKKK